MNEPTGLTPDDLDRTSRDAQIRDRALAWYRKAEPEIKALGGHEATADKLAIAQLVVMIELGASMYTAVRKDFNAETAQELLRQGFSAIGAVMRRNGEDVRMQVNVEFSKVAAGEPDGPGCEDLGEKCDCTLDQDGRCDYCIGTLQTFFSKMSQSVLIVREASLENHKSCRPCIKRHMDLVMAAFVRKEVAKLEPDVAEAMMNTMFMASQSLSGMPMPLTLKAWGELMDKGKSQKG